jgi:uncharacterized membrane protein (DUF106 family)
MFLKFIIFLFVIGIILRFVLRFLMPVFQVSRMAHRQMTDMKKKMEEMNQQQSKAQDTKYSRKDSRIEGEYIDYEEVK